MHEERVKEYFTSPEKLTTAYEISNHSFQRYVVTTFSDSFHNNDQFVPLNVKKRPYPQTLEEVIEKLEWINEVEIPGLFNINNKPKVLENITRNHPEIVEAYNLFGKDKLMLLGGSKTDIESAIKYENRKNSISNFDFIYDLHDKFQDGRYYKQRELVDTFKTIIEKHNIPMKATIENFKKFFEISTRTTNKAIFKSLVKCRQIIKANYMRK